MVSLPEPPAPPPGAPEWGQREAPPRVEAPAGGPGSSAGDPPSRPPVRRDWLGLGLALLIGFASVFSAAVAWRASLASIEASRLESLVVQQQARRQQLERQLEGMVAQDLRFAGAFQEHALAARELSRQADELRPTDPQGADALDVLAHNARSLVRAVQPFFNASGLELNDDGAVEYDAAFVLDFLRDANPELRELNPERTLELANAASERTINLIAVAALLVAALLLLTVGQVARRRLRIRSLFAAAGGVLVAGAVIGFVAVELL